MDGAGEFRSAVMEAVCSSSQIEPIHATPYQQTLVGLVVRFNGTIKNMLVMYVKATHDDWDRSSCLPDLPRPLLSHLYLNKFNDVALAKRRI